uniref:ABC transporter n=1 Tax=Cyberlindnera americana TaxID=36016 RepID=A0A5P8N8S7_9ASCO|nr:ABC transporter [Cyberlindnera americana]
MSELDIKLGRCPKLWNFDDLTPCGRILYFDTYWPALLLSISLIVIILKGFINYKNYKNSSNGSKETDPLLADEPLNQENYTDDFASEQFTNEIKKRHFDTASLPAIKISGEPHGRFQYIPRSKFEKFRVIFECLCILSQIVTYSHGYYLTDNTYTQQASIINITLWVWLLLLTTIRIANLNDTHKTLLKVVPNLWVNNFVIYLFLWFSNFMLIRSALAGNTGVFKSNYIIEFILITLNFVNLLTSKIGYRCPSLYISDEKRLAAPEPLASLFTLTTFSWVDPLIWKSHLEVLKQEQVWDLSVDDFSYYIVKSFKNFSKTRQFKFKYRLMLYFLPFILLQCAWAIVESFIVFAPTILLKRILEFVEDRSTGSLSLAWFYVFIMFFSKILSVLASGQALFLGRRVCVRLKSVVIGEIYGKALRRKISTASKAADLADAGLEEEADAKKTEVETTEGEEEKDGDDSEKTSANLGAIINLMAVDAFKISEVSAYLHAFVGALSMTCISIYLLWVLLGWSALIGAASVIAVSPLNFFLSKIVGEYTKKMLAVTDRRIQKLNETLQSIRIIKFFAWESKFEEQILKIRNEELSYLRKRCLAWACSAGVFFIAPSIVTCVSFSCYIFIEGKTLTTPIAFTALSLFSLLRGPLDQLSDMLSWIIQSKVSLDRVQDFLDEDETTKYEQLTRNSKNNGKIGFKDASFSWGTSTSNDFKLKNLNVDFQRGKLNVIIGPTGSGKTSLLMALLGEMENIGGEVYLPGFLPREDLEVDADGLTESVAYCSQAAWLLNDSIKNNIIFGSRFNKDRYKRVVDACGLTRDFEILKAGDQTEIGEKGITLSGGQKQRVSLARALYSNSRHVLLDDCLSAVDSHTALHIYDNCISGPLMENRTVLLVSHNVALTIKSAVWVVIMDNGKISKQGTPDELYDAGALGNDDMIKTSIMGSRNVSSLNLKGKTGKVAIDAIKQKLDSVIKDDVSPTEAEEEELENLKKGKLIQDEAKSDGSVSLVVYSWFFQMLGGLLAMGGLFALFGFSQAVDVGKSYWIRAWAQAIDKTHIGAITTLVANSAFGELASKQLTVLSLKFYYARSELEILKERDPSVYYITVYAILGIVYTVVSCMRIIYSFFLGIRTSKRIFKRVLHSVLRSKLRFFDSTPIGRIMNRFSKDIEALDQDLIPCAEGFLACVVSVLVTLALITAITPGFFFLAALVISAYYMIGSFYLGSSRELKRFDSLTKSPIHQHFSETLVGVSTIRAYGIERRFLQENLNKIDENNRPFFYMWVCNRWLSVRNDTVGAFVVLFAGCLVLWSLDTVDAGLAGISLSYAIAFNESALWVVRLYANVEMNMNSVERLKEYLAIDEEPAEFVPGNEPPASWPEHGKLVVKNLSLRYAPNLPKVIKNVTFEVESENKIGVVGRTGAGKSTIITALFRFLDPETGSIEIDGVDITSIGLTTLRQALTIIPQDPTLFTGTIKSNLDPFSQYSDLQMFEALKRVNLISEDELLSISENQSGSSASSTNEENVNKFLNLGNEVSEGGSNLSQGQRQLMCLARSLLRSPKIMLLDEATASIDYESDAKIQQTIRQEFSHATILTIAHRLRSIIDYDKILVMDAGEVVEFDHPYKLISDTKSTFHSMCADSGELDVLIQLAKEAFLQSVNSKK